MNDLQFENLINNSQEHYFRKTDSSIMDYIKDKFFNHTNYEWQIKRCAKLRDELQLNSEKYLIFLNAYFNWYYNNISPKKGKIKAILFLSKLNNSPQFKSTIKEAKLPIKHGTLDDFLQSMRDINKECIGVTHVALIKFIHENFEIQSTKSTLYQRFYKITAE